MTTTSATLPNGIVVTTENILRVFRAATPTDVVEGATWYQTTRDLCAALAHEYDYDISQAIGIFAALSPRTRWSQNVMLATRCMVNGGITAGTLGASMTAANRIVKGEPALDVLNGPKVRAFYGAILEPTSSEYVVIDAHAFSIAAGTSMTSKQQSVLKRAGVYDIMSGLYREAANILGITPSEVQAITWIAWRNLPKSKRGK